MLEGGKATEVRNRKKEKSELYNHKSYDPSSANCTSFIMKNTEK
jgi:hypothetical protein